MSESRFEPRLFLVKTSDFAHKKSPEWKPRDLSAESGWTEQDAVTQLRATARTRAELLAAKKQHEYCLTLRAQLKKWQPTEKQAAFIRDVFVARGHRGAGSASKAQRYAALTGNSYYRLMKMLRGEIIMRLEDILIAKAHMAHVT